MSDTLAQIFDTSRFMPHGHCYLWRDDILLLHVISDSFIAIAYYSIPVVLLVYLRKRDAIPFPYVISMFAIFILACGTTHLMAIWTIWNPDYMLSGMLKAITALVSVITAIALIPLLPKALSMPSHADLEAEIERRRLVELELSASVERLDAANKSAEQFVRIAAHDLKAPLRRIANFSELVKRREQENLSPDSIHYLDRSIYGANRLQNLIGDLLLLSNLSSSNREVGVVNCEKMIREVQDRLGEVIHERAATLHIAKLPNVKGYASYIEELFQNLIENGIKYQEGENPEVRVEAQRIADHWQFTITDKGSGIPAEHQKEIFEPFVRLNSDTSGTGLGLAISRKVVELMGGKLWLESVPGQGTSFHFTLPAAETADA